MNFIHIIYQEETKKFMVDYEEIVKVNDESKPILKDFLSDLNAIQTKRRIKIPWWYWVYLGIFIVAIPILIVFCWPAIVAMAGFFILLSLFVYFFYKRETNNFRNDVNILCENYKSRFGNRFYLVNYFNNDMFPPEEHDYEGLAILLSENYSSSVANQENMQISGVYVPDENYERLSRRQMRESRKSRPSKPATESYVQIGNYIRSENEFMTQENLDDIEDLNQQVDSTPHL